MCTQRGRQTCTHADIVQRPHPACVCAHTSKETYIQGKGLILHGGVVVCTRRHRHTQTGLEW